MFLWTCVVMSFPCRWRQTAAKYFTCYILLCSTKMWGICVIIPSKVNSSISVSKLRAEAPLHCQITAVGLRGFSKFPVIAFNKILFVSFVECASYTILVYCGEVALAYWWTLWFLSILLHRSTATDLEKKHLFSEEGAHALIQCIKKNI